MKWLVLSTIFIELISIASTKEHLELYAIGEDKKKKEEWVKNNLFLGVCQIFYLFANIVLLLTKRWEPAVILFVGLVTGLLKLRQKLGKWYMISDSIVGLVIWYHLLLVL